MLRGKTVILQVDAKDLWTNAKFLRDHKTWVRECITFLQKKSVCVHPRNCISVLLQAKRFLLSWECKSIKKCCTQKHWNYIFPHILSISGGCIETLLKFWMWEICLHNSQKMLFAGSLIYTVYIYIYIYIYTLYIYIYIYICIWHESLYGQANNW